MTQYGKGVPRAADRRAGVRGCVHAAHARGSEMSGTQIADDPANAQNPASAPAQRPPAPPGEAEFEVPGRAWPAAWPVAPGRARTGGARARRAAELLIAALLLAGVVLAAVYVIRGAFFTDPTSFPAVLEPPSMTYLQFSNEGQITGVSVQPGQTMRAGQVLASQSTTLLQLRLSYDQASLNADQANLTALPAKQTAQQQDLDLAVTVAQKELSAAEAQLSAARTSQEQAAASAAISAAQAKVALAESALVNGTSAGGGTSLAAAQAAVARDQAAVASDLVALKEAVLTAPTNGVIAFVGGTVGDLAGPTGISIGSTSGVQVPSSSGFSLFPPAPQAPSTSSQSGSAADDRLLSRGGVAGGRGGSPGLGAGDPSRTARPGHRGRVQDHPRRPSGAHRQRADLLQRGGQL